MITSAVCLDVQGPNKIIIHLHSFRISGIYVIYMLKCFYWDGGSCFINKLKLSQSMFDNLCKQNSVQNALFSVKLTIPRI